jgi:hypothetical protein
MEMASIIIARAAGGGKKIPDDIWNDLSSLPGITIDKSSFSRDGPDVIFSAKLTAPGDGSREVWARVGTLPGGQNLTLEEKLLQDIADLEGKPQASPSDNPPPLEPPQGSSVAANEGPGDYERNENKKQVVGRLNTAVIAVYGKTKDEVTAAGRIST